LAPFSKDRPFFLSINRYERKKNHGVAVSAFASLAKLDKRVMLVIAGGFDERVAENRQVFAELSQLVAQLDLGERVLMLRSVSQSLKMQLLRNCVAVVYTPRDEHFGIVPLEAMVLGKPVIASNSGGPTETVADGVTGLLCLDTADSFGAAMQRLLQEQGLASRMGAEGVARVAALFGFEAFRRQLNRMVTDLHRGGAR
jgi:alpha-1,3/alpha-1,6-mannosyltransferase